jgi:hypothetical protein
MGSCAFEIAVQLARGSPQVAHAPFTLAHVDQVRNRLLAIDSLPGRPEFAVNIDRRERDGLQLRGLGFG